MKAIETKYLGPTNYRGSRIKASDNDGNSVTISYDHALSSHEAHHKAAEALKAKMGWTGQFVCGSTKHGYVFVFTS